MKTDTHYMIRNKVSNRITKALKEGYGEKSRTSCLEYIGCSIPQLRKHLESQFTDGMTWGNHGAWHIDHIKPCAAFDLSNKEEQFECFHYSNVQPLWAEENMRKGATWGENKWNKRGEQIMSNRFILLLGMVVVVLYAQIAKAEGTIVEGTVVDHYEKQIDFIEDSQEVCRLVKIPI
jgi:hypothetical protein